MLKGSYGCLAVSPTMTMIVLDEDDLSEALVDIDVKDDVLFQ